MILVVAGCISLGLGIVAGMAIETHRIGDLIVMRTQRGECMAYDPRRGKQTVFGMPSKDGICHLARYRAVW